MGASQWTAAAFLALAAILIVMMSEALAKVGGQRIGRSLNDSRGFGERCKAGVSGCWGFGGEGRTFRLQAGCDQRMFCLGI